MSADQRNDFPVVRRGYDPEKVKAFIAERDNEWERQLTGTAEHIEKLESQIADAKSREEAVHLTLVAATKTKEELLGAARKQLEDAKTEAQEQATQILANAKREAFQMVTQSTQDAEQAVAEAKTEVERIRNDVGSANETALAEAEAITSTAKGEADRILGEAGKEAEDTIANARSEALGMLSEIKEESERMVTERENELERLRAATDSESAMTAERIGYLKTVASDLEERLKLLAQGAFDEVAAINSTLDQEIAEDPRLEHVIHQSEAHATESLTTEAPETAHVDELVAEEATIEVVVSPDEPVLTQDEPREQAAAPMSEEDVVMADLEADAARAPRGSFYSRRSARLPRIGADAASGALAAVSAMRARAREEADLAPEGDPESSEDLAMQTA